MPGLYRNFQEWVFAATKNAPDAVQTSKTLSNKAAGSINIFCFTSPDSQRGWIYESYFFEINGTPVNLELNYERSSQHAAEYRATLDRLVESLETTRYFKEDHLTGAMYIALVSDGSYKVTAREHVGVWVEESGRWSRADRRITFSPKKSGASTYAAAEVTYKSLTFLSMQGDSGPSIAVPIEEIEHDLDKEVNTLPLYVFFEVDSTVYERDTKLPYPFRTLH